MRRFLLALPLLLAACAQGPTLAQRLTPLVGQSEGTLVAQLGVPIRTYEADGRKFLEFQSTSLVSLPGDPYIGAGFGPYRGGFGGGYWGSPTTYANVNCSMTFALQGDRVQSFSYRGSGCA